uniref:Cytoskeleton-associated protein 2 C-terminal domain-containing protein n=1 Tax=Anabas testudineus TaxID=64144 RepID=A0A7N6A8H0_ANATE
MDSVGNKENTEPAHGSKSFIKRAKTTAAPFQLKNNERQETLTKSGPLQAKARKVDTRSVSGEPLKNVKTVQKDEKGAAAAANVNKIVAEAPKPPAAVPSAKSAPGMYKGKIVQSKIGSIWKSSAPIGGGEPKSSAPKTENQRVGNVSVFSRSTHVSKPSATRRPPAGFCSARPPARTVPATLTRTSSKNTTVAPTKGSGTQSSKPKATFTDKVNKPPVSSKLSQYRFTMETTEQRRAKLAEWLTSKGKTLKRPAMPTAAPQKTKVNTARPEVDLKSQSHVEQLTVHSQTPAVMDTTLELLENSDADLLIDSQDRIDDVVVNLCDALEALATPSRCNDEYKKEEEQNEMLDDCGKHKFEPVKNEEEESDKCKVETDDEEEEEGSHNDVSTPQVESASVVKYSVKTTPYLQSVKRTIEGEASTSTSRRKSNIKDLKFLTPVRRSCRIQQKSSHLPTMLVDHDPCVSSLAELVKLDDDPNAYIYRKNPALLKDLPDQPGL